MVNIQGKFSPSLYAGYLCERNTIGDNRRIKGIRIGNLNLRMWGFENGYVDLDTYVATANSIHYGSFLDDNTFVEDQKETCRARTAILSLAPKVFSRLDFYVKNIVDGRLGYRPLKKEDLEDLSDDDYLVGDDTAWRFRKLFCGFRYDSVYDLIKDIKKRKLVWFGRIPAEAHQKNRNKEDRRRSVVSRNPLLDVKVYRLVDLMSRKGFKR
jgi:hypothetical protein